MSEHSAVPAAPPKPHHQSFWLWVMCLTGVDYFSTLGYQPSIAYENAGLLAPLATIVLVLVTLFGALPIYWYVCGRSHTGEGSIGMLARLVSGWPGLHVRAYSTDTVKDDQTIPDMDTSPNRVRLLRMERLAPAV
jgi:hypothetical protein